MGRWQSEVQNFFEMPPCQLRPAHRELELCEAERCAGLIWRGAGKLAGAIQQCFRVLGVSGLTLDVRERDESREQFTGTTCRLMQAHNLTEQNPGTVRLACVTQDHC